MTTEEAQIQSASTTASPASATAPTTLDLAPTTPASSSATPTTCRSLPRYKGRQIDNTDLLDSIDQVGTKLAETLALVDLIQNQPTEQVTTTHNRSTRPARASRPARPGTDLMVTSTPEGCSIRRWPAPVTGLWLSEYGLQNTTSNYAHNIQRCFDLCSIHRPRPKPRNFVNMVRIEEYQEVTVH